MKLRNKKTGEVADVESLGHAESLKEKFGHQVTLSWATEYKNLSQCKDYTSLAELNEEWEDYEEPKTFWAISWAGEPEEYDAKNAPQELKDMARSIGNYFETREEAEKAVEKLKALKRLEEKGLHVTTFYVEKGSLVIRAKTYNSSGAENWEDLDLLFEAEEE